MLTSWFHYDFGYSWPFTLGHLIVCLAALALVTVSVWRGWRAWATVALLTIAAWGAAGTITMHYAVQISEPSRLPTEAFLPTGGGHILELGAGSGRATVGLLLARPEARVTAVDLYRDYYGIDNNTPERLRRNAQIAGVADRVEIKVSDMRTLPFENSQFDAAMSVAAIDHLGWNDIKQTMRETARVLKPGGQFLVVSLNSDAWVRIAIPSALHGGGFWGQSQNRERWRQAFSESGFDVIEVGTAPATLYFLAQTTDRPDASGRR